ncbi:ISL3 family transposase [Staphylococcus simiae]|nr:ISL3 family transposase [Staphylococcus simiae]PNZ13977.1 ISL3 family transposase [Staphylococcus simiae]SNV64916.1 transposase for ISSha1 [Staphylococcus simiae]
MNLVRTLIYKNTLTYVPDACEHCGAANEDYTIVKNGKRKTMVKLLSNQGTPCFLELHKQRFFCRQCHSSFVAQTSYVKKHCHFSNKLIFKLIAQCEEPRACKGIAREYQVSTTSIIRYINQHAESIKLRLLNDLLEHIMVDEFKSVKNVDGKMSFIFCDSDTHEIVDILPNRKKEALFDYFIRFDRKTRKKVKTVTMDMHRPYIDLFKQLFPNAKIILDRFHLIQALNRELNRVRIRLMNQLKTSNPRLYRKLILKPSEDLDAINYSYQRLFKGLESQQSIVNYILNQVPELKEVYIQVNRLRALIMHHKSDLFVEQINQDLNNTDIDKRLKRVINSFKDYLPEIINTLNHPTRSNGAIEAMNNNIKVLKRVAYGFRNFYNFRNRILITYKLFGKKENQNQNQTA